MKVRHLTRDVTATGQQRCYTITASCEKHMRLAARISAASPHPVALPWRPVAETVIIWLAHINAIRLTMTKARGQASSKEVHIDSSIRLRDE